MNGRKNLPRRPPVPRDTIDSSLPSDAPTHEFSTMNRYARVFLIIRGMLQYRLSRIASTCGFSQRITWGMTWGMGLTLIAGSTFGQSVPEQGFRIMTAGSLGNCIACHSLPGQPGIASTFGPPLDKVATRYGFEELRQWVTDARKVKPDTLMPPFGTTQGTNAPMLAQSVLTEEQILHVVAALQTLK